jgi:hypothetical protein
MEIGDKLSNRFGGKGVIADIIPDDKMPRDGQDRPLDILVSPLGIISRTNSSQLLEGQLAKIAEKTGKRYILDGFSDDDLVEFTQKELAKHNMKDAEDVFDPSSNKTIPGIFTGNAFFYKLQHTAEGKGKARATGAYTEEGLPAKGSKTGSKTLGSMEIQALLGHNSTAVLKDMKLIKGQRNDDFWRQLKLGQTPAPPKTPEVYEKFKSMLMAAGIHFKEDNVQSNVHAMTRKEAQDLTGSRRIENANTYSQSNFRPMAGGLFDPELTGSLDEGKRWAYIELDEPVPNPVMEDPLRNVLGMTRKAWAEAVREGKAPELLSAVNVDKEIEAAKQIARTGNKTSRPNAIKKLRVLQAMKRNETHPSDYLMDRIPVLPPKYRPITQGRGMNMVNDANYMYKALMESVEDLRDSKDLTDDIRKDARKLVYDNYKATVGLTDPVQAELKQQQIGGILQNVIGKGSPKLGFIQRRVIGTNLDATGQAVIAPNPELKLNQVGLPEDKAWTLYEPFIVRQLVRGGMPATHAAKAVAEQKPVAYSALQDVVKQRPILINRAPTLHKYGIMAMWPVLTKTKVLQLSPSIVAPFGADYDGDSLLNLIKVDINLDIVKYNNCIYDNKAILSVEPETTDEVNMKFAADTKVVTRTAFIRIEDMPRIEGSETQLSSTVTEWDVPEGVDIYAYDKETKQHGTYRVTKLSRHSGLPLVDVQVGDKGNHSTVITCSNDHSLVFFEPSSGRVVDGTPSDSLGKMVPIKKNFYSTEYEPRKYIKIGNQINAGYKLGVFLGSLIGDGWVSTDNRVYISSIYNELQNFLTDYVNQSGIPQNSPSVLLVYERNKYAGGGFGSKTRKDNYTQEVIDFHITTAAAKDLRDLIGAGDENKTIPWQSLDGSHAHLQGMLAGLLATDGTVSIATTKSKKTLTKTVAYDTTSPYLRDGVQLLLRKLGIRSGCTVYTGTHSTKPCYRVNISSVDFSEFLRNNTDFFIPQTNKQKAVMRWRDILDEKGDSRNAMEIGSDWVPYPEHLQEVVVWLGLSKLIRSSEASVSRSRGYVSRHYAKQLVSVGKQADWNHYAPNPSFVKYVDRKNYTGEEASRLFLEWAKIVEDTDITWQQVKNISEAGVQDCWDITVPGPLTFAVASGVIVMDTMSYSVPVSQEAVDEAIEKMMPDTNLISSATDNALYTPSNEYIQGLYFASKQPDKAKKPFVFRTMQEALQAFTKGTIKMNDPIEIKETK